MRIRPQAAALAAAGCLALVPATAGALNIVYLPRDAAQAAHDAGFTDAVRQMPADVTGDHRWGPDRRIGKVSVVKLGLTRRNAAGIVRIVRRELRRAGNGGRVAVDELNPNHWTARQAQELRKAWVRLGDDVRRVYVYAAPAMVAQVGRADPRRRLPVKQRRLFEVLTRSGGTYLQTYGGGWAPLDGVSLAGHLTRWVQRWPDGRLARLGVLIGPGRGVAQAELWRRVRATPAGRTLISNGVGIVGGRAMSAAEARAWVEQYRIHRSDPHASPPGGDITPPRVGPPTIAVGARVAPGARYTVTANRPGRAVVRLVPLTGTRAGDARVIHAGPLAAGVPLTDTLPADTRPGRYRLLVTFWGEGTNDRAHRDLTVTRG